jgi:hypothetical protein
MNAHDELMRQVAELNALVRERQAKRQQQEDERMLFVEQLLRFGICPCVIQGRASTCCGDQS